MPAFGAVAFDVNRQSYHPLIFRPNPEFEPAPDAPKGSLRQRVGSQAGVPVRVAMPFHVATGERKPRQSGRPLPPVRYGISTRFLSESKTMDEALARLAPKLPGHSIITTHVIPVKDIESDHDMSFDFYTAWQGNVPIKAEDITGDASIFLINHERLKNSMVESQRFAAIAYDMETRQFLPVVFGMTEAAGSLDVDEPATFVWMGRFLDKTFPTLDGILTYFNEGLALEPHEKLTTHVLLLQSSSELRDCTMEVTGFGLARALKQDYIKKISMPKAEGATDAQKERRFVPAGDVERYIQTTAAKPKPPDHT